MPVFLYKSSLSACTGKLNPSSVDETAASRVTKSPKQGKQYLYIGLASLASPR